MHVGVGKLMLRLPGNDSLKGKRRVIHSLVSRVTTKFNVAVAEVGDQDSWQRITLGIAVVSNEGSHANSMLSNVVRYVEQIGGEVEVLDYEIEILEGL